MKRAPRARVLASILVPVAVLVALLSWAVSSPPGSSPDDDYHMASIWCATGDSAGVCESTGDPLVRVLPSDLLDAASCFAFKADQAASCPRDETGMRETSRGNWNGEAYPPLYYIVMHTFVTDNLSVSIILMRAFNAILSVGLLTGLFFALPRRMRPPLVWGIAITAVPLGMFIVPSVNPSSWAVLSAAGLWVAAWGFFRERGVRKVILGVLALVFVIVGAGARADSAAYAVLALIAACVLAFQPRIRYLWTIAAALVLAAIAFAFFFSGGQSAIVGAETVVSNQTYSLTTLAFINLKQLPQLLAGAFGVWGLGWLDTSLPALVWIPTIGAFSAVVFWGLQRGDWRKWIAVAGIAASVVAVPFYILLHDGVVVGNGVQPRYVYPLMIVLAGLAVVGFARSGLSLGRTQLALVAVGLTVANSIALHVNIRRYVTGVDLPGINLDRDIEWWWNAPISPMGLWTLGSVAFAAAAVMLAWAAFTAGRSEASESSAHSGSSLSPETMSNETNGRTVSDVIDGPVPPTRRSVSRRSPESTE